MSSPSDQWYDQSDLEQVKARFDLDQKQRVLRRKVLISQRSATKELLDAARDGRDLLLNGDGYSKGLLYYLRRGEANRDRLEAERYYWSLVERALRIEYMLYDLVLQERKDLDYIARLEDRLQARERAKRYKGEEIQKRDDGERLTPKTIKRRERSANFANNRQHKNRASKRLEDVSGESPDQNS